MLKLLATNVCDELQLSERQKLIFRFALSILKYFVSQLSVLVEHLLLTLKC
jgi:hypothetical protein